jgi:hypothetical protein
MRYSPFAVEEAVKGDASNTNRAFFEMVAGEVESDLLHAAILLVGGNDVRSLALRRAQAALRFDRRVSDWSHAALIVAWQADVAASIGVEVSLEPENPLEQVPERNGVTPFRLARYFDEGRFPNVALYVLDFDRPSAKGSMKPGGARSQAVDPRERRLAAIHAALEPNRDRERYGLWEGLAPWARYAYAPDNTSNPLLEGVPMPSAALCEYAFEAAGVDLTPGATGNYTCPEVLHATMKHWAEGLREAEGVGVSRFSMVRDECGLLLPVLSKELEVEVPELGRGSGPRRAKKATERSRGRSGKKS